MPWSLAPLATHRQASDLPGINLLSFYDAGMLLRVRLEGYRNILLTRSPFSGQTMQPGTLAAGCNNI